jgi:curved DNA-binding protein CbpA
MRAHPDKGGSEEAFDAVTRAYAYLGDILRRVRGGRDTLVDVANETPETVNNTRSQAAEAWKMGDPVKLNPKNLDMNAFNQLFEEMRIPDPDGDGYGDWLKGGETESSSSSKFGGKFNRDVFNSAFEDEMRSRARDSGSQLSVRQPEALNLAPTFGLEIGRDRPDSFTAANLNGFQYTDLKQAYTSESTFSHQVAGVQVGSRSFNGVKAERGSAPTPLSAQELADIQESERQMQARQQQRVIRAQEEDRRISDQFARIKQRVIMDAAPVQKSIQNGMPAPRQQQLQNGGSAGAGQRYAITNH